MCKYRAILLFLLLIIYLNEVGARKNRNTRRKEKCTKPDKVSNARLKTRYERKEWFNDGEKVIYRCQPGYTMEGTRNQRWCRKGNWTGVLFTCNQKCTKPDNVSNAELKTKYKRKERFNDGDSVEYKCQPGYTKEGQGTLRKRWCRKGKWTGVRFSCNPDHPYRQSTLNQDLKAYGDISIDQILAKTNNKENVGDLEFELMELDIIVDKNVKTPSRNRANINKDVETRWEPEIHYAIDDEISQAQELAIRKAIPVWQRYSCLSFSENKQGFNRIEFKFAQNNVCTSSNVGMKQGPQTIKLGETCFETEIILHEIGHALGFYHEHNRSDRDDYIKIHYENIEPGQIRQFKKQENAVFDTNYDYLSIMHYGQYFFSRNESANLITIETTNDTFQSKIGMAKHPSFQDYKTLNVMFKCADWCPNIKCPEAGFVGKYCKCYCKGNPDDTPVRLCNKTGECLRPTVNKYLFYVMGKDKKNPVNMNRTSFPDKTVLNLVSTNWDCTSNSQLRCEDGDWKEISITECPVTLNISLTDETEGVVKVTLNGVNDGYICDDDWDDNDATVACKMLGYTNSLAYFLKPEEVNESLPILLDNVQCSGNELSLAECKHNGWGNHDCRYSEVVTVKCSNSSLPYHIDKTDCGLIKLSNPKRKKRQLKVSGGLETIKGMYPWQVGIQRKIKQRWIHWCGGTIINDKWILSAAHCLDDLERKYHGLNAKLDLKDVRVIVGDHDLTKHDEYEEIFYIEYIVKHWNYSEFKRSYAINDIALLKIKSNIVFNEYIQPACLPESFDSSETKCEVSGWGKEKENGNITDTLRAAQVTIIQENDCRRKFFKNYAIDFGKVICAGDDGADTCQGDSGGPLICEINGKSTVLGITSWGKGCGQKEAPGVYTNVLKYLRWINDQISNHRFEKGLGIKTASYPSKCKQTPPSWSEKTSTKNVHNQQLNENEAPDDIEMEDQSDQHINKSKGCKLSTDRRYMYFNLGGVEKMNGDHIDFGDTLTVKCRFIDIYTFMTYDYDYYNDTDTIPIFDDITISDDITIVCKDDHTMTKIKKECPEETKDKSCLQIDNGSVNISNSYFVVSCDKGFSLDIFEPNEKRSNCIDGKLKSVIGGQEPKCIPARCKVPYEFDTLLSISDRYRVSLSGGSVVEVGHSVYLNCSKAEDDMHEPVNRRFKCINGQWIEDERNKSWKFGNNGNFPKCRKTICEPECENGGVCLRDDECKCKHFTSGKRCENVLCDDKCKANNGECVGPGKCRCPQGKFGTNCELSSCRLPVIENMAKFNPRRSSYAIGETVRDFTCSHGHILSSDKGMTCLNNGTWSDVITCVKGLRYLISAKTGTRTGAGTDANVYISLIGSGGSTRRIDFRGEFESGDVDEIRVFAKDIRPIHQIQIGHDGRSWHGMLSYWDLEYISIYVENMEEFYVFRNNRKQWVEKDNELTLNREGSKACINSFDNGHLWYLDRRIEHHIPFERDGKMSLRECKQSCVNWKDEATQKQCVSVYYDHRQRACSGFTFVDRFYPINNNRLGKVYLRTCKHNDTF